MDPGDRLGVVWSRRPNERHVRGRSRRRSSAERVNPSRHAVLWLDGSIIDLGTLGGPNSSVAWPVKNNRGLIDPRTAAATAAAYGIKVYTIGVGTIGEAPIPTGRGLGGFRYELLPVRIDEPLLREIASKTGGRYFRARDSEALSRIFRQIDELEKSPIQVTRYTKYEEATRPLILLGLAALALELVLGSTLVVRVP